MDPTFILGILQGMYNVPYVGKVVVVLLGIYGGIVGLSATLGALATSVVTLWQALQKLAAGLSLIPGLAFFSKVAAALQTETDSISSFQNGKLIPILNRLSSLPLPTKPQSPDPKPPAA